MKNENIKKGPWGHRLTISIFSLAFMLLLTWLLGFILHDIGQIHGPDFEELEKQFFTQEKIDQLTAFRREKDAVTQQINTQKEVQGILQTSTENSQQTMNQLLEKHKLDVEKNITPSEAEQTALAESETLFLQNQRAFQEANQKIAGLSETNRNIDQQIQALQEEMDAKRKPLNEEYERQSKRHLFLLATVKLSFLVPLLLLVTWWLIKKRSSVYAPIIYPCFVAVFWRIGVVIHQYFPSEIFKYIAIGAAIVIVLGLLVHLIRMAAAPKIDWLLKQYKEAYIQRRCPICSYPIEQGEMKFWPRFQIKMAGAGPHPPLKKEGESRPYNCPACGTQLFEPCEKCGEIRHSLLPYCEECGHEKSAGATGAPAPAAS